MLLQKAFNRGNGRLIGELC